MPQAAAAPTKGEVWTGAHAEWISPAPSASKPQQWENPLPLIFYILLESSGRPAHLYRVLL